jgi:GMP synthase-like glutamine amidotransferase
VVAKKQNFLIVQHMDWEGPGEHLLAALAGEEVSYRVLEAWHEPVPSLDPFSGMIVLGGSPNVDEEEQFPYLRPLKAAIREVIAGDKAYLGFCLGHQLLGHVLGCRVGPLPNKSVGFITGELTPAGRAHPAFQGLPSPLDLFKWHGQGVLPPLPREVEILAHSPMVPVEAVGLAGNPRVVGLQYDNHAGTRDVQKWLEHDGSWALSCSGAEPRTMLNTSAVKDETIGRLFRQFMGNFLKLA